MTVDGEEGVRFQLVSGQSLRYQCFICHGEGGIWLLACPTNLPVGPKCRVWLQTVHKISILYLSLGRRYAVIGLPHQPASGCKFWGKVPECSDSVPRQSGVPIKFESCHIWSRPHKLRVRWTPQKGELKHFIINDGRYVIRCTVELCDYGGGKLKCVRT